MAPRDYDEHKLTIEQLSERYEVNINGDDIYSSQGLTSEQASRKNKRKRMKSEVDQLFKVIRDGAEKGVELEDLVPGDLIKVEPGLLHADIRLLYVNDLLMDTSMLTGETDLVPRSGQVSTAPDHSMADNMIYAGCIAKSGFAYGVIVATGVDVYMATYEVHLVPNNQKNSGCCTTM